MREPATIVAELQGLLQRATVLLGELIETRSEGKLPVDSIDIDASHRSRPRYTLDGKPMLVKQLAAVAGCTLKGMEQRLARGMTPEEAVAAGADMRRSRGTAPVEPRPAPTPAPRPVAAPIAKAFAERQAAFEPDAAVIEPANVKRTVAETPPDRFHVEPDAAPSLFSSMRPGQYESTGSAIERYYAERQR